jgi:hypothetical protein
MIVVHYGHIELNTLFSVLNSIALFSNTQPAQSGRIAMVAMQHEPLCQQNVFFFFSAYTAFITLDVTLAFDIKRDKYRI